MSSNKQAMNASKTKVMIFSNKTWIKVFSLPINNKTINPEMLILYEYKQTKPNNKCLTFLVLI